MTVSSLLPRVVVEAGKSLAGRGPLYRYYHTLRYRQWVRRGRPIPPPHVVKQRLLAEYARRYGLSVLVETGTYKGDMVFAMLDQFRRIFSIELSEVLCAKARRRFAGFSHVELLQGDSADRLRDVIEACQEPCLFWLDAHYAGDGTAKTHQETPVIQELGLVLASSPGSVILIDDARCFETGVSDYPSIEALREAVARRRPEYVVQVEDDVIRVCPDRPGFAANGVQSSK